MENSNKVITIVAGVIVTLLVVLFGFGIYYFTAEKGESIKSKLSGTLDSAAESLYTQYAGMPDISGGSITGLIVTAEGLNDGVSIIVTTKAGSTTAYVYGTDGTRLSSDAEAAALNNARKVKSSSYINPKGHFTATIQRDANDVLTSVTFTQD